jgi:hypothetical protein
MLIHKGNIGELVLKKRIQWCLYPPDVSLLDDALKRIIPLINGDKRRLGQYRKHLIYIEFI